ncbi:MAG TPA: helicase-related protein [Anaerolineales bacterium]|nr:helicase-related protein [Anaerolineales bacterium]
MAKLEDLKRNAQVKGLTPSGTATILNVQWHGDNVVEVTYRDVSGKDHSELLFRDRESELEVVEAGTPWAFDSDGELFRLVSEAYRIRMAYLFDPWMAVHLSQVEPLPHQITAVYGEMIPRQPLRFLLADDPGAGKTIMTGLFVKELMLRGDLQRCLIVVPGNLVEQWQDELYQRFQLPFEILTNDRIAAARTGNALNEMSLVVARLDKLSRDEELQAKLSQTEWDLIVVDEAHKMSASVFGGEIKYTKRYHLGELLSQRTRHLLLLTATPHNGKEEDFQLFMALLDPDRFEGKYREGVHDTDASDLMRRLVKERLRRFDGTPLFPERRAYTVTYQLSDLEAALYEQVTSYVREEFNRADKLDSDRRGTIGFALTVLQRRLASSPEAIYQSLKRRRERLESRLREEKLLKRGRDADLADDLLATLPRLDEESLQDFDEAPEAEVEETEEQVADSATAARTIAELELEIARLKELETLSDRVRHSGQDRKWTELARLLQEQAEMFDQDGRRRKLVIFTEHRDTLTYLADKIRTLLGRHETVVTIHGGIHRDDRRATQASFVQDKDVLVLVATDAAGEGINLQRAHLMINYDLPWNPTRLEQRFGRIHRIGQTEVCHLWNLVADETREGEVYAHLLRKIEIQREALHTDGVFDILGKLFRDTSLRQLLMDAIRYGDQPEVRARLFEAVDNIADQERVRSLLEERSLAGDTMDISKVHRIREDFERAQARRLQPHFVASFFKAAFEHLGGTLHSREPLRYEISHVPAVIRTRARLLERGVVLTKYERITFHKEAINVAGKATAEFVCPGHPLMDAVTDLILERYRSMLKQGAILVDPSDAGEEMRTLFYLEHSIQDARPDGDGNRRVISRQMQFVEVNPRGEMKSTGPAPFLDYHPLPEKSRSLLEPAMQAEWLRGDLEAQVRAHAAQHIVPEHLNEVKKRREEMIERTNRAVHDRLTKEIAYWDHRAQELKAQEQAGRPNARLNSDLARRRADDLQARLQKRMEELEQERHIAAQPPVVIGGALIIPAGLLARLQGETISPEAALFGKRRKAVELAAMRAVMDKERQFGFEPEDVSVQDLGWDIESRIPGTGKLRFIEVKGRAEGATTVTISKNEILAGLNKPEDYYLAVVEVAFAGERAEGKEPIYIRSPFQREPDFAATSVNYELKELLRLGTDRD